MGFWEILVLIAVFTKYWSPIKGLIIWIGGYLIVGILLLVGFLYFNYSKAENIKDNNIKQFEQLINDGNYNTIIDVYKNSFVYHDYEWFDESVESYDFKCDDHIETIRIKDIKSVDNGECFKISELDDTFIKYENAETNATKFRYYKMLETLKNHNINIDLNSFKANMKSDNYVEYIRGILQTNHDDNFLFVNDSTLFNTVFKNEIERK